MNKHYPVARKLFFFNPSVSPLVFFKGYWSKIFMGFRFKHEKFNINLEKGKGRTFIYRLYLGFIMFSVFCVIDK